MRFFYLLLFLGLALSSMAQNRINNIRFRSLDSARLEIQYDLFNTRPGDSIYVQIQSRIRGRLRLRPELIQGDVGINVPAGTNRQIVWNARANGYTLNEEIKVSVLIRARVPVAASASSRRAPSPEQPASPAATEPADKPAATPVTAAVPEPAQSSPGSTTSVADTPANAPAASEPAPVVERSSGRYAGPAWALLSAVAPGIGNIFVQTPRPRVGFRPIIFATTYSLILYGLKEKRDADDAYALYQQQRNSAAAEPYYQTANDHYHRYYIATRGAIAIAAADVVLTFLRGLRNNQQKRALRVEGVTVRPGLQAGQPTAQLRYTF
ncbi:hypothetical protein [Spirosoma rhododendri]|uniref:DUF5683 domain-containing protein n=1 Tax=Spirosoma rhododendri TaxID=2728024 RepID=A0A7L5DYM7_9BACT|nr:hypothetical protein [Spirosoma rhododendri]QJD80620.1 hypothetical protein HH216_21025 [Spirosoma rhododendri]